MTDTDSTVQTGGTSAPNSIEERLNGSGALPWIPDPANAKKWRDGGDPQGSGSGGSARDCYEVNPIVGTAVDHYVRETEYGTYDVLVLNVEGIGDVAVHCRGAVLQNEMFKARPRPGEKVGVKLTGEGQGKLGKYPIFRVVVERNREGTFGWSDQPQTVSEFKQPESWQSSQQQSDQPRDQSQPQGKPAPAETAPAETAPAETASAISSDDIPF